MGVQVTGFPLLLDSWDEGIRAGHGGRVHREILRVIRTKFPDRYRRQICALLRRIGDHNRALSVITPCILDESNQMFRRISSEDLAEYASVLIKLGMHQEAVVHLRTLPSLEFPKKDFFLGLCHFGVLDYAGAIPYLRDYLKSNNLPEYDRCVGKVNLLSALVETQQLSEALELSDQLIEFCEGKKYLRLLGNCKELKSQVLIERQEYSQASKILEEAHRQLAADSSRYLLWIQKAFAVIKARQQRSIDGLLKLRHEMVANNDHEIVRELDFECLSIEFNTDRFCQLYFGTMFQAYREKLVARFPEHGTKIPETWIMGFGVKCLHLLEAKVNQRELFSPGQLPHQVLCALFSDLYRPVTTSMLFSLVFPEEKFNVRYSTERIKQLIHRIRDVCAQEKIEISVQRTRGGWRPVLAENLSVLLHRDKPIPSKNEVVLRTLTNQFRDSEFSTQEARAVLQISLAQCKRELATLIEHGLVKRVRAGRRSFYSINGSFPSRGVVKIAA